MAEKGIEILTWDQVRNEVHKVNPGLAEQIDQISPGKELKLFKARYPFGCSILQYGVLQLPNDQGKIVSMYDDSIDKTIRNQLSYVSNMPVGIVLNKTIELYYPAKKAIIPYFLMRPGRIFALWGLLQERQTSVHNAGVWIITSGCRSLTLLPKISDALGFKRLKKEFGLTAAMPAGLSDQWDTLKQITEAEQFNSPWEAELLFFPESWYKKIRDGSWKNLEYYLLKGAWEDTAFLRNENVFNLVFSRALEEKNLKPNPFLYDTVKHIYNITKMGAPGFRVAIDDSSAPIKRLEQIFAEVYQLRFAPTFVHSGYFDPSNPLNPVYYSLEIPTLTEFSPKSRKAANKMNDIREIKHIQSVIEKFIREDSMRLKDTPIYEVATNVSYEYYHSDKDMLNELESTDKLSLKDEAMKENALQYKKPICTTSPFLRGCVRIGVKSGFQIK